MFYVIAFDISDNRARYRATKVLKGVGTRVQKSVFECANINEQGLLKIQAKLEEIIDHSSDSVRCYRICRGCIQEVEWLGVGAPPRDSVFTVV
jgi:CRISPR-associated protein Cas2